MPSAPSDPVAAPAICRAGEFQFAPGQTHLNPRVQSRGLFWCKSGHGTFRVNYQEYSIEPHDLYVLPWNRRIEYTTSKRDPMFTAHVHVVPWIRPGSRWVANVPHGRGEPEYNSPDRADVPWPGFEGVVRLRIETEGPLARLLNYTTSWFRNSDRAEPAARALGLLVVGELQRRLSHSVPTDSRRPEELNRILLYIERGFQHAPTVDELATILGRSRSHVLKLFKKHLNMTAKSYIQRRQIQEARDLLLSTTLPVGEVGRMSGFPDPYHFSKLFHQVVGMPPKEFRAEGGPLPVSNEASTHRRTPPPPTA